MIFFLSVKEFELLQK